MIIMETRKRFQFQSSELTLSLSLLLVIVIPFSNAVPNNGILPALNKLAPVDKFNSTFSSVKVMGREGGSGPIKLKTRLTNKGQAKPGFHRLSKNRTRTKEFQASPLISVGVERLFLPTVNLTDPGTEMENLLKYGHFPYTFWKGKDAAKAPVIIPFEPLNNSRKEEEEEEEEGTKAIRMNTSTSNSYKHQHQRQSKPHMNYEGKGESRESETFRAGGYLRRDNGGYHYLDGKNSNSNSNSNATNVNINKSRSNAFHQKSHQAREGTENHYYQQVAPVPQEIAGLVLLQVESEQERRKLRSGNLNPFPYANENGQNYGKPETDGFRGQGHGGIVGSHEYGNSYGHGHGFKHPFPSHFEVHTETSEEESEELSEGRITIANAILGSKALLKGTALVLIAVVGATLVLAGLAGAGAKLSPILFPVALLPIALVGFILFIPSIALFVPLVIKGLAGTERRRYDEKRRRGIRQLDDVLEWAFRRLWEVEGKIPIEPMFG